MGAFSSFGQGISISDSVKIERLNSAEAVAGCNAIWKGLVYEDGAAKVEGDL
jgi:hypothetical protein